MAIEAIKEYEAALLRRAKVATERQEDGGFVEEALVESLAAIVPFDVEKERRNKAKALIARSKRPGATKADGQLLLPGFNAAYDFEPERMVSDDGGHIIESRRALPRYKAASVTRAEENVEHAVEQLHRQSAENRVFQEWALEQALAGRPRVDLTWGNCVIERGLLRRKAA